MEGVGKASGSVFKAGKRDGVGEGGGKGHQGSRMAGQDRFNSYTNVYYFFDSFESRRKNSIVTFCKFTIQLQLKKFSYEAKKNVCNIN